MTKPIDQNISHSVSFFHSISRAHFKNIMALLPVKFWQNHELLNESIEIIDSFTVSLYARPMPLLRVADGRIYPFYIFGLSVPYHIARTKPSPISPLESGNLAP